MKLYIAIISHAPEVKGLSSEKQEKIIGKLQEELPQLKFIDCRKSLTSDDFYDPLHPNKKEAEKISTIISTTRKDYRKIAGRTAAIEIHRLSEISYFR